MHTVVIHWQWRSLWLRGQRERMEGKHEQQGRQRVTLPLPTLGVDRCRPPAGEPAEALLRFRLRRDQQPVPIRSQATVLEQDRCQAQDPSRPEPRTRPQAPPIEAGAWGRSNGPRAVSSSCAGPTAGSDRRWGALGTARPWFFA